LQFRNRINRALSRAALVAVVVVIIIIIVVGGYAALNLGRAPSSSTSSATTSSTSLTSTTSSSSSSAASSSSSSTSSIVTNSTTSTQTSANTSQGPSPSSLTYEVAETPQLLDPDVSYYSYDSNILQNVYEPLVWYNGSSSTQIIPWLASNYTVSSDGRTVNFTLRSGIHFADGEPLNSTAVYFSLNRLLVEDASSPTGHGIQGSWIIQQLANKSLSYVFGGPHKYDQAWLNQVLAQDFVQVTGPLTFVIHVQNPNTALLYLLAGNPEGMIVAPNYVMQHDLAVWNQSSTGYKLPYPTLTGGNETGMIGQYFSDEVATCDAGLTPSGCGRTYLDDSAQGSLAGTGPYKIVSFDATTNDVVLQSNPNYWGGPYQFMGGAKIVPHISTINLNYVPQQTTRELDLKSAATSGRAFAIEVTGDHLYDVADRNAWLNNNNLTSTIPGVALYGPYTQFSTLFAHFATNVTNKFTGQLYTFQPFADIRFRLAFADSVNMSQINQDVNNKLGQVANTVIPPGLPPLGSYNASIPLRYSYNPDEAASLMLQAMQSPITKFTFFNGTAAPAGLFNNTFGCRSLGSGGTCSSPVPQTITLTFSTGDTISEGIYQQIASTINNISVTYNMGLTVDVVPLPIGQMITELSNLYSYSLGWVEDYPWVTDFLTGMYSPTANYGSYDHWNLTAMNSLTTQMLAASASNNSTGLIKVAGLMNELANQQVMYLLQLYPAAFTVMTTNVHGFFFNPSLYTAAGDTAGPQYFAALY